MFTSEEAQQIASRLQYVRMRHFYNGVCEGQVGQAVDSGFDNPRGRTIIVKFWNSPMTVMTQVFSKGTYVGLLDEIGIDEYQLAYQAELAERKK